MLAEIVKNTLALLAIVEPLGVIPLFMQATIDYTPQQQRTYARFLGITVIVALVVAGLIGEEILSILSISLGAMQVGGGVIVLMVAIAMVLGQQNAVKRTAAEKAEAEDPRGRGLVPLGIPLLVGPAAFSFMLTHSTWHQPIDLITVLTPPILVGALSGLTLQSAGKLQDRLTPATLNVIERIAGFLLAGIAVELMASGLRALFPLLAHS
ncbi:MAG TPA: MarC family protein [Rhodocyclaceae bacterium]|nr:MarC family protein [Rhodocyclaceae bacterium]